MLFPYILISYSILAQRVWNEGERPYWDMPKMGDIVLPKLFNPQDYVLNPFHQPNEIYDQYTCHGGGDGNNDSIVDILDKNLADAGTDAFALDVNGDGLINTDDGDIIQQYIDGTITILPSWWNFLNKEEKLDWFTKMANIYTVDQKQYIDGDENTRYISGNYATEFCIRMQGYNENILDLYGFKRKEIPAKYSESLEYNGIANIPMYFVSMLAYNNDGSLFGHHGMNTLLIGDNPLDFNDWVWYEPQGNIFVNPGDWTGAIRYNSLVAPVKLENIGGSGWGEDMTSPYLGGYGNNQGTMKAVIFEIDSIGNISVLYFNEYLLSSKPTVSIERESSILKNYSLGHNYPNPFNPSTTIRFKISNKSYVSLKVFDITGSLVKILINNSYYEGNYSVLWKGINNDGQPVSSGIYYYQLKAGDFVQTKKMLLLR